MGALAAIGALAIAFGQVTSPAPAPVSGAEAAARPVRLALGTWAAVPADARAAISRGLGAADPSDWIVPTAGGGVARVAGSKVTASFDAGGVTVAATGGHLRLGLSAVTAGGRQVTAHLLTAPAFRANRVNFDRGPVREWYVNGRSV